MQLVYKISNLCDPSNHIRRNPWTDRVQILFGYRDPGRNHVYEIW